MIERLGASGPREGRGACGNFRVGALAARHEQSQALFGFENDAARDQQQDRADRVAFQECGHWDLPHMPQLDSQRQHQPRNLLQ